MSLGHTLRAECQSLEMLLSARSLPTKHQQCAIDQAEREKMTHTVHAPSWSGTNAKPAQSSNLHSHLSLAEKDREEDGEEEVAVFKRNTERLMLQYDTSNRRTSGCRRESCSTREAQGWGCKIKCAPGPGGRPKREAASEGSWQRGERSAL